MSRPIDADKLLAENEKDYVEAMLKLEKEARRGMPLHRKLILTAVTENAYREFVNTISNAPTVEERPVGKWLRKDDHKYHCSICDSIAPKGYRYNFCPYCGTDMKGDFDDETD